MKITKNKRGDMSFLMKLVIALIFLAVVLGITYMLWKGGSTRVALFFKSCSPNIGA